MQGRRPAAVWRTPGPAPSPRRGPGPAGVRSRQGARFWL